MVELVDTIDSKSIAKQRAGSSPVKSTNKNFFYYFFSCYY